MFLQTANAGLYNILLIAIYLDRYNFVCQIILQNRPGSYKISLSRSKKKTEIQDLKLFISSIFLYLPVWKDL